MCGKRHIRIIVICFTIPFLIMLSQHYVLKGVDKFHGNIKINMNGTSTILKRDSLK